MRFGSRYVPKIGSTRARRRLQSAAPPPFRNILRHPIGRGKTQAEAVHDLLGHAEFVHRALSGEWPLNPDIAVFLEVASDNHFSRHRDRHPG
jgi:hypothetical protein